MSKKNPNDTMKVLVSIPVPKSYSRREVVCYVRDAVRAHADGFVEDGMIGESRKATARELPAQPMERPRVGHEASTAAIVFALGLDTSEECTYFLREWSEGGFASLREEYPEAPEEVYLGADCLQPKTEAEAPPALTPVQVLSAVVRGINSIPHIPPASLRQNRREYWKAGARACLQALNVALHKSAQELLGPGRPLPMDSELFSYWVEEARRSPRRVALALGSCQSPDEYRVALWGMVAEDEDKARTSAEPLNPEGGLA